MKYNYSRLLGRITEKGFSKETFAAKIGISRTSLYFRLQSTAEFSQREIERAIQVLDLDTNDIPKYFFNVFVQKTQQSGQC